MNSRQADMLRFYVCCKICANFWLIRASRPPTLITGEFGPHTKHLSEASSSRTEWEVIDSISKDIGIFHFVYLVTFDVKKFVKVFKVTVATEVFEKQLA